MYLFFFILILVTLIVVHELGHFTVAKLFGIKVEEFGVGFPPRLLSIKKGETTYSVNLLFFGGFVRIFGENITEAGTNPRSFANKPKWVQAAVIAAGIICNLLFAWLILSLGYMVGMPTSVTHDGFGTVQDAHVTIVGILPNSPAQTAGLEAGDIIEKIITGSASLDPRTLNTSAQSDVVRGFIAQHSEESIVLTVARSGVEKTVLAKPAAGFIEGRKAIGVQLDDVGTLRLAPHLAVLEGGLLAWRMTASTAVGLATFFAQIVTGHADFASVAGPIGIAGIGSQAVKNGFAAAISLAALISINLALINVLPIPGLDGGRLFLILLESIRRKSLSEKLTFKITIVGFALLIGLMLIVSYHDIVRLMR